MTVTLESPNQPDVIALIEALDAYQDTLYPPEARYALDLTALCQPEVLFAVARDDHGVAQGCAAVVLGPAYGEVKRMFVTPGARGTGLARQILQALEHEAQARGCTALRLETGPAQPDAIAFYERQGFLRCGPFGDYPDHPLSVFMGKALHKAPS
jgi:putative acetyltransferase